MTEIQNPLMPCLDFAAEVSGGIALTSGVLHRAAPLLEKSSLSFFSDPRLFRKAGLLGLVSMTWHSGSAIERLFTRKSQDRISDGLMVVGAANGIAAMLIGMAASVRSVSHLARRLQTASLVVGVALDLVNLAILCERHGENPAQVTTGQIMFQAGLTVVFGCDLHTSQAPARTIVALDRKLAPRRLQRNPFVDQLSQALRVHDPEGKISGSPHLMAATILRSRSDLPAAFGEGIIESLISRGMREGNQHRQYQFDEAMRARMGKIVSAVSSDDSAMERENWGDLLEVTCRRPRQIPTENWQQTVREAREALEGAQWMRAVSQRYHSEAARAGQLVGLELEFDPPAGWGRDTRLRALHDELKPFYPDVGMIKAKPYRFSDKSVIYPYRNEQFKFPVRGEEVRIDLDFTQGTGDVVFFGYLNSPSLGNRCLTIKPSKPVAADATAEEIFASMRQSMEEAYAEVAHITGSDPDRIRQAAREGTSSSGFFMKDDTRRLFYIDLKEGRLVGRDSHFVLDRGSLESSHPQVFGSHQEAYVRLKEMVEGGTLKMRPRDRHEGVKLSLNGKEFQILDKAEHREKVEIIFDPSTLRDEEMLLIQRVGQFLQKNGAQGNSNYSPVSLQGHVEIPIYKPDSTLTPEYILKVMRAYYRFEGKFRAAVPTATHRGIFINEPRDKERFLARLFSDELDQQPEILSEFVREHFVRHYSSANWDNVVDKLGQELWDRSPLDAPFASLSGRSELIQTLEFRVMDTPEMVLNGKRLLDPDGVLYYTRFLGSFTYAALNNLPFDLVPRSKLVGATFR